MPSIFEQAADGFDNIHDATVGSDTGEQVGDGFDNIGDLVGIDDASGEAAAVVDPTRSASGPAELGLRAIPGVGPALLAADGTALMQQITGQDSEPVVPGATSPLIGSRDADDAVQQSGYGSGGDAAADYAGDAYGEAAGAVEGVWNAATPNLPINFQQGVLIVLGLIAVVALGQLFDVGIGGSTT
jgi:hypothetical protein